MNNFDHRDFYFFIQIFTKMEDKVTKICMDIYRKLGEKSGLLNIIEGLQTPNTLEK
jgi:hypothetical protein